MIRSPRRRHFFLFTLFEVIIVIVIMGTALGLLLPRFGKMPEGLRRANAVKIMNSAFHMASSISAATGKPTKLVFNIKSSTIQIQHSAGSGGSENSVGGSLFADVTDFKMPTGTILDPYSTTTSVQESFSFQFYPNGEASGPPLSLFLSGSDKMSIDVDRLTGRPLITQYDY